MLLHNNYTAGAELIYSGRMGAAHEYDGGGGGNFICMPEEDIDYLSYGAGVRDHSYVYGTEYDIPRATDPLHSMHDHNAPCSLCYVPHSETTVMIPARIRCPTGWRKEYAGYIMTSYRGDDRGRTTFECIDQNPEAVPGQSANTAGAMLHHVEAHCNGMPCPPYDPQKELTCVICSK